MAVCTVPSIHALKRSYISSRSTPPQKGKAKHFISTSQTLESQSPVKKSQWIRDAYKKYKVFLSNRGVVGLRSFTKCYLKKDRECSLCYTTDETVNMNIACCGSQSSGFFHFPKGPASAACNMWVLNKHLKTHLHLSSWILQTSEPAAHVLYSITDHKFSFTFVDLFLYSSVWHKCTRKYWF